MKNKPKHVFLNIGYKPEPDDDFDDLAEVTWSKDMINSDDIAYGLLPKPHTAEMITFLLVSALRLLDKSQRHSLTLSLAVRDPLFTIEEYINRSED
jgi:hypothetical protein